jgi:hypothetical protein
VGIDFYEVIFKRDSVGTIYSASATRDKVLSVQLPVGTYEAVLLAGIQSTGVLLASDYLSSVSIEENTPSVTFELVASKVAVTTDVKFNGLSTSGTQDGYPYFSLIEDAFAIGTISITDFPDINIFGTAFTASQTSEITSGLKAIPALEAGLGLLEKYAVATADAVKAAADAKAVSTWSGDAGASLTYAELVSDTKEAYEDLSGVIEDLITADIGSQITLIKTAFSSWGASLTAYPVTTTSADWGTLKNLVDDAISAYGTVYTEAYASGSGVADSSSVTSISTAESATNDVEAVIPTGSTPVEIRATYGDLADAVSANSPLTLSSLNIDSGTGGDAIQLPIAVGGIDLESGDIIAILQTPAVSGFTKLYYNLAFQAYGEPSLKTWRIKEGLDNYYIDNGSNSGGSILLGIGNTAGKRITIIDELTGWGN